VRVEGRKVILEPVEGPPKEVFVRAGSSVTERILREVKSSGDKAQMLLEDLGVPVG